MNQSASSPAPTIKTQYLEGTTIIHQSRRKCGICSLIPRLICITLVLLLIFVPLFLFLLKWSTIKDVIHGKVLSKIRLAPMSAGFENWSNPPVSTRRAYRLFNITNYMDLMTKTSHPTIQFEETQPMYYEVKIKKNNVQWTNDNKKIQYSTERFFQRHGQFSEDLLNQEGAFVDILRAMFRTKFERVADPLFYILGGNNAFNYSKAIDKVEGYISPIFVAISARMQGPNKDKYGFIYRYNGSNGFNFTIHTGIDNSSKKGQVIDFASEYTPFKTEAKEWQTEFFDGMTFPPMGNPPNRRAINVFQPDLCRPIQLRYNRTLSMFGIDQVHEYVLKLVDVEKCPSMDENCPEADKLDITRCFSAELPEETIFLTKPHMYGHDSSSTNVAFTPDATRHESTIYFEPMTGTPLQAQSRIQLNVNAWIDRIKLNDDGSTQPTKSRAVRRLIPMMWIDQTITLNEATANRLKLVNGILRKGHQVHQSLSFVYILAALLSIIAVIVALELFLWKRQATNSRNHLLDQTFSEQKRALLNQTATMSPIKA